MPELIYLKNNENQYVNNCLIGSNNNIYHDPFTGSGRYVPGNTTKTNLSNLG